MQFNSALYGKAVRDILALDGDGWRLMPLAGGICSSKAAQVALSKAQARDLFPASRASDASLSGLWLYFSCLDESHTLSQDIHTIDGSFWHGIMHRQEPDAGNAGYWFRRVGAHPVYADLRDAAADLVAENGECGFRLGQRWDPLAFIDFCEQARRKPGSAGEQLALKIQRAEWQILFDYCAGAQ